MDGGDVRARAYTALLTLWALLGLGVAIAVAVNFSPLWWITAATTAALTASGLLLIRTSEQRTTGFLLLVAAGAVNLVNLRFWAGPHNILDEIAYVTQWAPLPFLALAYLTYPEGGPFEPQVRHFFVASAVWAFVPRLIGALFSGGDPATPDVGWWSLADIPGLITTMGWVELVLVFPLAGWATVLCAERWIEARGTARGLRRLMAATGILVTWGLVAREVGWGEFATGHISRATWDRIGDIHQLMIVASILIIGTTAASSLMLGGPLVERLLATAGRPLGLERVLREQLIDPSLRLYFLVEDRWLGADGTETEPPVESPFVDVVTLAWVDGKPTARVAMDPSDRLDPVRRRIALAASRLVLNAARLSIERDAYVSELAASRSRIAAGAEAQRRQLERTLHDGIQQVLLAAATTVSRAKLASRAGDSDLVDRTLDEAHTQMLEALAELRRLARGIYPAPLAESGLVGGVQSLTHRWPDAALHVIPPLRGYAEVAEEHASLIYFAVAEGLANAYKHGRPPVTVTLRQDADSVTGEVFDTGTGGACFEPGGGLAGLRDRVQGLGGTLVLTSIPGSPTRLVVTLPRFLRSVEQVAAMDEREHRQDAPMGVGGVGDAERAQDGRNVRLNRPHRNA